MSTHDNPLVIDIPEVNIDVEAVSRAVKERQTSENKATEVLKKYYRQVADLKRLPKTPEVVQSLAKLEDAISKLEQHESVAGRAQFGNLLESARKAATFPQVDWVLRHAVQNSNARIIEGDELEKIKANEREAKALINFKMKGGEKSYFFQGATKDRSAVFGLVAEIRKAIGRAARNWRQEAKEYQDLVASSTMTLADVLERKPGKCVADVEQKFDSGDRLRGTIVIEVAYDGAITLVSVRGRLEKFLKDSIGVSWHRDERIDGRLFHLLKNTPSRKREKVERVEEEVNGDTEGDEVVHLGDEFGTKFAEALQRKAVPVSD